MIFLDVNHTFLCSIMVTTRGRSVGKPGDPVVNEASDFRDAIASEVREELQQLLHGLFTQIRTELLESVTQRIVAATQGSSAGQS